MPDKYSNQIDGTGCSDCWKQENSVFRNCQPEDMIRLFSEKKVQVFKKGEHLITRNDPFRGVYCIITGLVKVTTQGARNKEFILWFTRPGDLIGLDSYVVHEDYNFSAMAASEVQACFIPEEELKALIQKNPGLQKELMKALCQKIGLMEDRITSISRKKIKEHFAEVLLTLAQTDRQSAGGEMRVDFPIKDLANLLGTTKNYLYKILSQLSEQNIIAVKNRKLFIRDQNRLSHIAVGESSAD